jgi:hypothetical protein
MKQHRHLTRITFPSKRIAASRAGTGGPTDLGTSVTAERLRVVIHALTRLGRGSTSDQSVSSVTERYDELDAVIAGIDQTAVAGRSGRARRGARPRLG